MENKTEDQLLDIFIEERYSDLEVLSKEDRNTVKDTLSFSVFVLGYRLDDFAKNIKSTLLSLI